MTSRDPWYKKLYGIEKPTSQEVLRCAVALCGGQVELPYLKNFISMNEMYFPIFHEKTLEKHGILCDGKICTVTNFEYNDRNRKLCKHLTDYYRF